MPEALRVLGDEPVASLDIRNLRLGEELLDGWHRIIRDVARLGTSHKESRAVVLNGVRLVEGKVRHLIKRMPQHGQGHAELQ